MMNVLYYFLKDFLVYMFIIVIGVLFLVTVFEYADAIVHGKIRLSKKNDDLWNKPRNWKACLPR